MYGLGVNRLGVTKTSEDFEWEPLNLFANSEQGAWYDPSDLSSMKQLSNGTVDAAVDSPVGYIEDKSGNGNTAIQATANDRPTLREAGGLYYLEFSGAQGLQTASVDFTGTDEMTASSACRKTGTGNQVVAELSPNVGSNNGSFRLFGTNTIWRYTSSGDSLVNGSASGFTSPNTSVLLGTSNISDDQLTFRVDGDQEANPTSDQGSGNYGNYAINIGSRNNASSLELTGFIYGMVIRNIVSSSEDISNIETYLAGKSGVTL